MLLRYITFSIVFVTVMSRKHPPKDLPSNVYYDPPCLSTGGLCIRSYDCPAGKESTVKGLCPARQEQGYECCYSVPQSETRCRKHGGVCYPRGYCPENLTYRQATDCDKNELCCILVR